MPTQSKSAKATHSVPDPEPSSWSSAWAACDPPTELPEVAVTNLRTDQELSARFRSLEQILPSKWRYYLLKAKQYEEIRKPEVLQWGRQATGFILVHAVALKAETGRDRLLQGQARCLLEEFMAGYPEVPWESKIAEMLTKHRSVMSPR